ncbi:hypothetical protein IW294_22735 [Streptomyces olivaceus]|uniref:hypothetical protein n=1 Tax=Streptomyces olivaceus TaxID=47716 RepID=UPI0018A7FD85|nr:hypothetical protein [Streptomyces olivaceus]MBF8173566.1 hypothetical protein [Streptomyces olivaceus]
MSTTTTGEAPGPRRWRRSEPRPERPASRRRGTGGRRDGTRQEPASGRPVVLDVRAEQRFLDDAERRGAAAARSGALDPLTLQSDDRVPYFAALASVRDRVIRGIGAEAHRAEEQARLDDAHALAEAARLRAEVELIDREVERTDEQIATTTRQLDLLAMRSSRWNRFRDSLRERVERNVLEGDGGQSRRHRGPGDEPDDSGAGTGGTADGGSPRGSTADGGSANGGTTQSSTADGTTAPGGTADDGDRQWVNVGQPAPGAAAPDGVAGPGRVTVPTGAGATGAGLARAWEGLHKRPAVPDWMRWALLGLILAVELPIYWVAYQPFHGIGNVDVDVQTGVLAAGTAVLMVILPHLAGLMLRRRPETGSVRAGWLPALSLLGVWAFLTGVLGVVRAKYVMQTEEPPPATDGFTPADTGAGTDSLIERLSLEPWTVTWLFVALLVLSGGIGFLLALCREHPHLDAYRTAIERRGDLVRRRELSLVAAERERVTADTAEARSEDRRAAVEDRVRATRELHEAAAHRYLDGVLLAAREPAVTEAAMRLSQKWPLLPMTRSDVSV